MTVVSPDVLPVADDVGCRGTTETWLLCSRCARTMIGEPIFDKPPVRKRYPAAPEGSLLQPHPVDWCPHRIWKPL